MTSITRTLVLSLGVTATAIFVVILAIVIWIDLAREREQTYCQTAAAILNRATVVDPGQGLMIRSTGIEGLRSNSPSLWYVVSYDNLMSEFGRERRPALPFSLPYAGPIGLSVVSTLDQKSSFCLAVVRRDTSKLVMMIGGAQVHIGQIAESFILRNLFSVILLAVAFASTVAAGAFLSARFVTRSIERVTRLAIAIEPRAPQASISLDEVPVELKPLVSALNRAFHEINAYIQRQRRFLGNAAHQHRKAGARARPVDHPGDYDGSCRYADDHIETGARDDGLPPLSRGFAGTPRESRTRNVEHLDVEQARRKFDRSTTGQSWHCAPRPRVCTENLILFDYGLALDRGSRLGAVGSGNWVTASARQSPQVSKSGLRK
jgi:hypothetical protein